MNKAMSRDEKYASTWGTPVGQDCISLDTTLCEWLGERMVFLSENAHGHPPQYNYEGWTGLLAKHGYALIRYAKHWDNPSKDEAPTVDYHLRAQSAMLFVAQNLGHFWD